MATWKDLSTESWAASRDLFVARHWRSSTSRSYYAVFARATAALATRGVTMPHDREGPSHAKLPSLLLNNLTALSSTQRRELHSVISRLYFLRLQADYLPSACVGKGEAMNAQSLMLKAIGLLKGR